MVFALCSIYIPYRFGATSAICDNIHGTRNQRIISVWAPRHRKDHTSSALTSTTALKMLMWAQTVANEWHVILIPANERVLVNSEHLLMTIRKRTSFDERAHSIRPLSNSNRQNRSKLCNSMRYELFHSFSVYDISIVCIVQNEIGWSFIFRSLFPCHFVCSLVRSLVYISSIRFVAKMVNWDKTFDLCSFASGEWQTIQSGNAMEWRIIL